MTLWAIVNLSNKKFDFEIMERLDNFEKSLAIYKTRREARKAVENIKADYYLYHGEKLCIMKLTADFMY